MPAAGARGAACQVEGGAAKEPPKEFRNGRGNRLPENLKAKVLRAWCKKHTDHSRVAELLKQCDELASRRRSSTRPSCPTARTRRIF